jgi:hypothetical protein
MDVNDLSDEMLDRIQAGVEPLDPRDTTRYYDAILEMLNAHSGPMTLRAVSDIVGAERRSEGTTGPWGARRFRVERLRNRV